MKKLTSLALCAVIVPAFAFGLGSVSAAEQGAATDTQQMGNQPGATTDTQRSSMPGRDQGAVGDTFRSSKPGNAFHSSDLVGSKVKNREDGKDIGSISNLIIDENGQIVAVVVGVGGFLGMGQKDVALPWQSVERTLNQSRDGYDIRANASESILKNAAEYKHN